MAIVLRINELYCPRAGWVKAERYNSSIHGVPDRANVAIIDKDGTVRHSVDITPEEYRNMLPIKY